MEKDRRRYTSGTESGLKDDDGGTINEFLGRGEVSVRRRGSSALVSEHISTYIDHVGEKSSPKTRQQDTLTSGNLSMFASVFVIPAACTL